MELKKVDTVEDIYNEFKKHSEEFEKLLGYSIKDIEEIGVEKFIKAMDWKNKDQVLSWKTDKAHIIPCIECREEFAVFEIDFGLCPKCQKKYSVRKIQKYLETSLRTKSYDQYLDDVASIMQSKAFREDRFLINKDKPASNKNKKKKKKRNKK